MEIEFCLTWSSAGRSAGKAFKHESAYRLFSEYVGRISRLIPCRVAGPVHGEIRGKAAKLWVCDSKTGAVAFASEALAARFEKLMNSGVRKLQIVIGGPDGFSESEMKRLNPDLKWSFGPLTLPHELASVVSAEQIYRALTIIRKLPYHLGH